MAAAVPACLCAQNPKPLWIDVPYVHQTQEACGDAALAMVIGYWAEQQGLAGGLIDGTPAQREQAVAERDVPIIRRDLPPGRHGISAHAMQKYLDDHGFVTFALQGTWNDLEKEIGKGRPLIVATRPRGDPQLHYMVIAGVDPVRSLVMMNDPAERKLLTEERAEFEKDWSATHNWLLLAVPQDAQLAQEMRR
jgi:hypothetical protein